MEPPAGKDPTSSSAEMIEQLSSRLDLLIRDVSFGAPSHDKH
ncbi:MAG TPA: hypothetical protein VGC35_06050 [Allosphingosinicella sp.]|jgi:hypothetical protein